MKQKKQFRLYDVYRYAVTGVQSNIEGISEYEVNKECTCIKVAFTDGTSRYDWPKNETELKTFIRYTNKLLNNCNKPGPKRRTK